MRECMTFKGTVHQKMKMLSSLSKHQVVPNMYEFLSSVTKTYILKSVGNQMYERLLSPLNKKVTAMFCLAIVTELHYTSVQL